MKNIELMKLGQKIQFERKKRNLSQEQLASLTNLSEHSISNIETGKSDIRYTSLLQIANAFDMSLISLLDFNL